MNLKIMMWRALYFLAVVTLLGFAPSRVHSQGVLREVFTDIPGTALGDLTNNAAYPDSPTFEEVLTQGFEAPTDVLENYGQRLRALITAPTTGNYVFWIASDDNGGLFLSSDESPANARLIASVPSWTSPRQWNRYPSQRSTAIALQAGRRYYLEALMKEGGGGDNLAVRWQLPGGEIEEPIPASRLTVFAAGPPQILVQPANTNAVENGLARFAVEAARPGSAGYQWQRNGADVAGATNAVYTFNARLVDQGARYRVRLSNQHGTVLSAEAILSVTPDTTAPQLVRALNLGTAGVRVMFSEGVRVPGGAASAAFSISGGVTVTSASAGSEITDLILATSALTYGSTYTLTVTGIQDLAQTPNSIQPNSSTTFVISEFAPSAVGNPVPPGGLARLNANSFDLTGGGRDLGGTNDQMQFAWELKQGDFDMQARVASVTVTDPFVHAGLVVRDSLEPNGRFAAVLASSPQVGCFFESRDVAGAASRTVSPTGGFPVNYPQTWLRLRRTGTTMTGYASVDGQTWVQLGTVTISGLPATAYLGMAVSSLDEAVTSTAQFRDVGRTSSTTVGSYTARNEPLGPSSRRTGLVISEIMYHPKDRADGKNLEFVELYNARSIFEDLTGWRISGDIDFRFPDGFKLEAGEFVVVAASPADLREVYGISNVLGPYTNSLPNNRGVIRVRNNADAIRLEVNYDSRDPWPVAPDGAGPSLVLARPSYGENLPQAWSWSSRIGGSPGMMDAVYAEPRASVVINEYLAHTDPPLVDFIELYNHSNAAVDLSGCWLTEDPATNRFRIPAGTTLPARGFIAFTEVQMGFRLNAAGDRLFLLTPDGSAVLDALAFRGQENGVSSGRVPDGADTVRRLARVSPGAENGTRRVEDVVFNEIMFHPISKSDEDEFIELHNRSGVPVDVSDWRLTGGIDFRIPPNTTVGAGGYLVVAKNASRLLGNYPGLSQASVRGDYQGSLRNSGDRLTLSMPDAILGTNEVGQVVTNGIWIEVGTVAFADGGRWGKWADGDGSSLELIDPDADPLRPSNWASSDESKKGAWKTVEFTGPLDNGNTEGSYAPNRLHILMQGPGECLVDDVEVMLGTTNLLANGDFEGGATGWSFLGNHSRSAVESGSAASGTQCLHVRGSGDGDTGVNSIRRTLNSGLRSGLTAMIRAKVRWLAGWPQVLFRTRGNWIEMSAQMDIPRNLGTPGLANSRRVANAGPAIYDVTHRPALPRANQPVVVSCRLSDPDGLGAAQVRFRVDPSATLSSVAMRDDGLGGDEVAGDGVYSATITGRSGGTLVAFRVEASDAAASAGTSVFPAEAPDQECLIRWDDPIPTSTFAHYHVWNTQATLTQWRSTTALNNTWRDGTLVYGNHRVIYNVGVRDKGSPYHGGSGDMAMTVPPDDLLLGATDRVLGSTGNGGSEETGMRGQVAAWVGQQLGIPYLHSHYIHVLHNGNSFAGRNIMEDLEQPNHDYAESWFPEGDDGDLYKVAVWFEFQDNNTSFGATGATLGRFTTAGGALKLARYRWNFQRRSNDGNANNYQNIFDLVQAANDQSSSYVPRVLNLADIEQWMRVFAYNRILGNWDAWSFNVGQNMYAFKQPGRRWVLMPWDIDFVLGSGNGPTDGLWGGQDPVVNRMYDHPEFRRMLWRAYEDGINGPMRTNEAALQVNARRSVLLRNGIQGLADPRSILSYLNSRLNYIRNQIQANNAAAFEITSNGGADFSSSSPTAVLEGTAPFSAATIEVNGIPYPVTWIDQRRFRMTVPLVQASNRLVLTGVDRLGRAIGGFSDAVTIRYTGTVPKPEDNVVLNEIHYNPLQQGASFIELFNRSTLVPFDLSGFKMEGVGYTFADGALIQPNSYLLLVKDRAAFSTAFGATIPVLDEFPGSLDNGGEYLGLLRLANGAQPEVRLSDVRYDNHLPWPTNADGLGPSLQLLDPTQDTYRVANWSSTSVGDSEQVTPGRMNVTRQSLSPFPTVWINEVLPLNVSGTRDGAGEREPWIELYNSGASSVDLGGLYLSDSLTNLARWAFPTGTILAPKQFLAVWADGETSESSPSAPHANFRLNPTNGVVALSRLQGNPSAPAVLDSLAYASLAADRGFGSVPDGEPRRRRLLLAPTFNQPNDPTAPAISVTINEILAGNTNLLADPADGQFDDWFELYNSGPTAVDLSGYSLTDNVTNWNQFTIPPGTVIPAGGFLLVWADEQTAQNVVGGDLHVNFKLALTGEPLALFAPDGAVVDQVEMGPQTDDVSIGRFPDGQAGPLLTFATPSPRKPNVIAGANQPPVVAPVSPKSVMEGSALRFTVEATDPDPGQALQFSLGPGAPEEASIDPQSGMFNWVPTEEQGPGVYTITVRATDDGTPPRTGSTTVAITVIELNRAPVLDPISDLAIDEGQSWTLELGGSDPDIPPNVLRYALEPGAPAGMEIEPATGFLKWQPGESQGPAVYTVTVRLTDSAPVPISASRTFRITVNEANNAPVINEILPQSTPELVPFTMIVSARDPDELSSPIRYSLDLAPEGASIDAATGVLTWTPTELQGPTNAIFIVRATETAPPSPTDARTFSVNVTEVNVAPVLGSLADKEVVAGTTLVADATVSDADLPAQELVFSLGTGSPAGASIDPKTGQFRWAVPLEQPASTNVVVVQVTDNGPGAPLSSATFRVTVRPATLVVINEIMVRPATAGAEFVELFNLSPGTPFDLSGLVLESGSMRYVFPNGARISPRGYLCVVANNAVFRLAYGNGPTILGPWTGKLEAGATLDLVRPGTGETQAEILDTVTYGSALPWPAEALKTGASLQLKDPLRDNDRVGNWAASTPFSGSSVLVNFTNDWRYFQSGPQAGQGWTLAGFNDAGWSQGRGALVVEPDALPIAKNTTLTLGQNAYYFRTRFSLSGLPTTGRLKLTHMIDDGAVFYLNGREILRFNMPEGVITAATTAIEVIGNGALVGPLDVPLDGLQPGENVLAVELHQQNASSSDLTMACELSIEAPTGLAYTPGAANHVAESIPAFPTLRINEVVARNVTGAADRSGDRDPWIELVNHGPESVSLEGLYLSNDPSSPVRWPFPDGMFIGAGGFLVVFADGENAENSAIEGHTSFRLSSAVGAKWSLVLASVQGQKTLIVDSLSGTVAGDDVAIGLLPDGDPAGARTLTAPTPGASNAQAPVTVGALSTGFSPEGFPQFSWTAVPGAKYVVEVRSSLTAGDWATAAEAVATSTQMVYTDPAAGTRAERYFRVRVAP